MVYRDWYGNLIVYRNWEGAHLVLEISVKRTSYYLNDRFPSFYFTFCVSQKSLDGFKTTAIPWINQQDVLNLPD